ncbi:protease inhibitor I42 family protein [Acinetobacter sp. WZC-1]|uniref:protease inhibitor I42 family protein n=1 Tax=Acinetobacter sp. WZC-1 TaxID=3459034 RepID=UPI00403DB656
MKSLVCMTAVVLGAGLSACQSSSPTLDGRTHEYALTQKCPTLLEMKVGENLVFNAPENPSTGYQWQLVQPLKLFKTEETYLQNEAEEAVVGAGGEKTFRFHAETAGQELIELVYVRAWESSKQPEQQWQCRVRVS